MAGKVIMCAVSFGCAVLFFAIGVYARKRNAPMWFWSGSSVDASHITDVKQYNKENGVMWQLYSLWFFAAGVAEFWNTLIAAAILFLGGTVGIVFLIGAYNKIYKKYSVR